MYFFIRKLNRALWVALAFALFSLLLGWSSSADAREYELTPLGIVAVADPVNSADDFGVLRILFDQFAEFGDMLVEGTAVGKIILSPAVVEQGVAVDHLSLIAV